MESGNIKNQEENEQSKKIDPLDNEKLREAVRTFLRVEKRVEVKKFIENNTTHLLNSFTKNSENKIDLNKQTIDAIITVLIEAVEKARLTKALVEIFSAVQLSQIEYMNFQGDPLFSIGYTFTFNFNAGTCFIEIIDDNGFILQTGFKLIYTNKIFSKTPNKDLRIIKNHLKQHYFNDLTQIINGVRLINYANNISQCYVSRFKMDCKKVNNFNIMNKNTWSNANQRRPRTTDY